MCSVVLVQQFILVFVQVWSFSLVLVQVRNFALVSNFSFSLVLVQANILSSLELEA